LSAVLLSLWEAKESMNGLEFLAWFILAEPLVVIGRAC
jgi:hypothetical protein